MKRYNKIIIGLALPVFAIGAASCDDKNINDDYSPAIQPSNVAFFSNTEKMTFDLSEDATSVKVPVYRGSGEGTLTVPVTVEAMDAYEVPDIYTFAGSVTFEDGETVAYLNIDYDIEKAEYDDRQQYELTLDENFSTPYGQNIVIITLVKPSPMTLLGTGTYTDALWNGFPLLPVEIYQSDTNPNVFKIENPYYLVGLSEDDEMLEIEVLQVGDEFYGTPVTVPNLVGYEPFFVTFDEQYGCDMYLYHPGMFVMYESIEAWKYNAVTEWQTVTDEEGNTNELPGEITLAPIYFMPDYDQGGGVFGGGFDYSNSPMISIVFPGYKKLKKDITIEYYGMLTAPNFDQYAVANVKKGSDLTKVVLGVGEGRNINVIEEGILDGSIPSVSITSAGEVKIPFGYKLDGIYTIVALGYAGDEIVNTQSVSFNYYGSDYNPNEGWTRLGYVEYTDGYVCTQYFTGITTYEVEIQENEETPGLYRLVNPYGADYPYNTPGDYDPYGLYYLTVDASVPDEVFLLDSPTALLWGGGQMTCFSVAGMFMEAGFPRDEVEEGANSQGYFDGNPWGTLKDGQITFPALSLMVNWGDDEYVYSANYALDYEEYLNGNDYDPFYYNPDGTLVAPFMIDLNTIKPTRSSKSYFNAPMKANKNYQSLKWGKRNNGKNRPTLSSADMNHSRKMRLENVTLKQR